LLRYRDEFPTLSRKVHLNTCSLGPLSRRSRAAVQEFLDLWEEHGASAWYRIWLGACEDLRVRFAALIGASAAEIALHGCVSNALAAAAGSIDYTRRPRVVVADLDFPTIAYQWLSRAEQGVEVCFVHSDDGIGVDPARYEALIDERTALIATSQVFFTTGFVQDLAALADVAHRKGALLLVDAYQGTGQIPTDVRAAGVDFLVTGGLKWLMGGPGLAYLYTAEHLLPSLRPPGSGWFATENQFAFDTQHFSYRADGRRMESGTPAMAAVYAGRGGLEILQEVGVERVRERTLELVEYLERKAIEAGYALALPGERSQRSGIATIRFEDPARAVKHLASRGIITDYRPGLLRLSPFFFNTEDEIDYSLSCLAEIA
jgi:selenocysteine lyase/cysteine desulfurase